MTSNLDAKSTRTVIQDFTGVYAEQPFMQGLRKDAVQSSAGPDAKIRWIDCSDIPGTDCYCDDEAVTAIRKCMQTRASRMHAESTSSTTGITTT